MSSNKFVLGHSHPNRQAQMFEEMAVLVDAQGEMLDAIEAR